MSRSGVTRRYRYSDTAVKHIRLLPDCTERQSSRRCICMSTTYRSPIRIIWIFYNIIVIIILILASYFSWLGGVVVRESDFVINRLRVQLGKATDVKFDRYIRRVHPNKSPFKISEQRERWSIQGLPKVFKYPLLSQERLKLRTWNFVRTFIRSITTEAH